MVNCSAVSISPLRKTATPVRATCLHLEDEVGLNEQIVDRRALVIYNIVDDAKALVNRMEQAAILLLALEQCRLGSRRLDCRPGALSRLLGKVDLKNRPIARRLLVDCEGCD